MTRATGLRHTTCTALMQGKVHEQEEALSRATREQEHNATKLRQSERLAAEAVERAERRLALHLVLLALEVRERGAVQCEPAAVPLLEELGLMRMVVAGMDGPSVRM